MIVKQEFKAGDLVRYIPMGDKEYVLESFISSLGDTDWELKIEINRNYAVYFTKYGTKAFYETHPLLILIRRPEEKKKWYQVFYKLNSNERPNVSTSLYENEEEFYTRGISKDKFEWIELKFVCER